MVCLFWMLIWNIVNTMKGGQLFTHIKSQFSLNKEVCLKTMESKTHPPFMDWLIDLYIDWSIDLLMDWLIFPGVKPLFKSFGNIGTWFWLIDWLIGWLCDWFQHGPVFAQFARVYKRSLFVNSGIETVHWSPPVLIPSEYNKNTQNQETYSP